MLDGLEESYVYQIWVYGYGAVAADNKKMAGYYLVQLASFLYSLKEDNLSYIRDITTAG